MKQDKNDEDDNDLGMNLNDFDSGVQIEEPKSNKKIVVAILIIVLLLIIAVIIFIVFLPDKNESNGGTISEIICKYNIQDSSKKIYILSEEYKINGITIYLNDTEIENPYKFHKIGNYII